MPLNLKISINWNLKIYKNKHNLDKQIEQKILPVVTNIKFPKKYLIISYF